MTILEFVVGVAVGLGVAAAVFVTILWTRKEDRARREAESLERVRSEAEAKRREMELAAKDEVLRSREAFEAEQDRIRKEVAEQESQLRRKEDALDRKLETFSRKERFLEGVEQGLSADRKATEERKQELAVLVEEERRTLHSLSGLTQEAAKEMLLKRIDAEVAQEAAEIFQRVTQTARREADDKAKEMLALAIQRCATTVSAEQSVSVVDLPGVEMKGRIIGREGRNIRAFERSTGADLIVDDTPGVVSVSAFDGVRREIAVESLRRLIKDGRIHPARIEELVEEVRAETGARILEHGKQASMEAQVHGLHPKQVELLGRLQYRTSGGSNLLRHSLEVSHLCGLLAGEFGLDVQLARRIGLLHDLGRAVDQEMEGGHAAVGADLARRYNERKEVVDSIGRHHANGEDPTSLYEVLLQAANQAANAKPGASRSGLERFTKRLVRLEEVARAFSGVTAAYAIQAGREIRVIVDPDAVNDALAVKLCRDIARQIERELTYPGEIQVTLLREVRQRKRAKEIRKSSELPVSPIERLRQPVADGEGATGPVA
ncbi:MAG: ribonuclease Y [Planctomycetes bacterium]|nr:ribonuclease Y [Planctomycetota bacterium]